MTPDRMVIDEARRTFTYLNLYGYLTDAVVVNRVFPAEVGPYFGAWRERQEATVATCATAFAPVPVLRAPFFGEEVVGAAMLDELGDALFAGGGAAAVLHDKVTEELVLGTDGATLRLDLPFARKGDVALKKLGRELVVRVDGAKRTLLLPPKLEDYPATGARLDEGVLHVTFDAPPEPADPLHDLRAHVRATQAAAERLAGEAADARAPSARTDRRPSGWATAGERAGVRDELDELAAVLRSLQGLVPAELQGQVAEVLRQVLLLVRAILDFWVDRSRRVGEGAARAGAPRRPGRPGHPRQLSGRDRPSQ